jgi:hypothetical protein
VITKRGVFVISLHRREGHMVIVFRSQLMRIWPRVQTTLTAIETHASYVDVVDHRLVVDVGDMNATEVRDGPVIEERATTPVAALKTNTTVPVAVVNSAVEPYVRSPIATVP